MSNLLPSRPAEQMLLFQRLRLRLMRNTARGLLQRSTLRVITMLSCSLLIWAFVFAVSLESFHFLDTRPNRVYPAGALIGTLFDLFFFALGLMLIFSNSLILYSSLFSSAETEFLL